MGCSSPETIGAISSYAANWQLAAAYARTMEQPLQSVATITVPGEVMSEPRPLHRLFGLTWIDYFQGTTVCMETEIDLSLKQQFLDVVIIRKQPGTLKCRTNCEKPCDRQLTKCWRA